jgi:hypothetical protein
MINLRNYSRSDNGGKDLRNAERLFKISFTLMGATAGYRIYKIHESDLKREDENRSILQMLLGMGDNRRDSDMKKAKQNVDSFGGVTRQETKGRKTRGVQGETL